MKKWTAKIKKLARQKITSSGRVFRPDAQRNPEEIPFAKKWHMPHEQDRGRSIRLGGQANNNTN